MFVGKARNLPQSDAPEMCFTLVGPSLTHKNKTRPEEPAGDKQSILFQILVNYGYEKFYNNGSTCQYLFFSRLWRRKLERLFLASHYSIG